MIEAWLPLLYIVLWLAVALVLLILEFFLVSFGLFSLAALVSASIAVYRAALWSPQAGYITACLALVLAVFTVRWGLQRVARSPSVVPQTAIDEHAGYQHVADRLGIAMGSTGVLLTPARPIGRARFAGGECDVHSLSGVLQAATPVRVERIDGPVIYVTTITP